MDYSKMSLAKLKELAKELGIKNVSRTAKADLITIITEHVGKSAPLPKEKPADAPKKRGRPKKIKTDSEIKKTIIEEPIQNDAAQKISDSLNENEDEPISIETQESPESIKQEPVETTPEILETPETTEIDATPPPPQAEPKTAEGILEILPDGYGFLRANNFLPGSGDTYIAPAQIRRFNLRTGDHICGIIRQAGTDKFNAISYIQTVNGDPPYTATRRPHFEYLTPIFPTRRITLETSGQSSRHMLAPRIIDLLSPVGFGQRGMIVSPPKAGKTVLLKQIANAITHNHPDVHLIVLLVDERPEEVTDMQRSIIGEHCTVVSSTFDEQPENHKRLAEMVLERAKRLVEQKKDLVILMDSITRLGRAYNLTIPAGGRTLSGGLDPSALYMPKKFFGAARNIEEGGSLTVLATALVDTGSKMDDVIFEEFKGTGNMELVLDRRMAERRVFPAIDIMKSGTRREDLLLTSRELDAMYVLREMSGKISSTEFSEQVADMLLKSDDNKEFVNGFMEVRKY